jgi:two-component system alkaline phosphatase synthesis response regulator PhoP
VRRRILIVEDDLTLRQALSYNLTREGYEVAGAGDGESALAAAQGRFDLILLDLMLPAMSGLEVLRALRGNGISTPVIIVSAKADEVDRVVGLKIGADDYVTKPFSRPELLARIEAVLRRQRRDGSEPEARPQSLEIGPIVVDLDRRQVSIGGTPTHLTTKEFDLLAFMASSPGRIFTRDQLLSRIWGYDFAGDGRTVDVHISWLRGKLRGKGDHNWFRTVRGVGYAFSPPAT